MPHRVRAKNLPRLPRKGGELPPQKASRKGRPSVFARPAKSAGFFPKSPGEEAREKKNRFLPADLADRNAGTLRVGPHQRHDLDNSGRQNMVVRFAYVLS
jgi:hypothetical protein